MKMNAAIFPHMPRAHPTSLTCHWEPRPLTSCLVIPLLLCSLGQLNSLPRKSILGLVLHQPWAIRVWIMSVLAKQFQRIRPHSSRQQQWSWALLHGTHLPWAGPQTNTGVRDGRPVTRDTAFTGWSVSLQDSFLPWDDTKHLTKTNTPRRVSTLQKAPGHPGAYFHLTTYTKISICACSGLPAECHKGPGGRASLVDQQVLKKGN